MKKQTYYGKLRVAVFVYFSFIFRFVSFRLSAPTNGQPRLRPVFSSLRQDLFTLHPFVKFKRAFSILFFIFAHLVFIGFQNPKDFPQQYHALLDTSHRIDHFSHFSCSIFCFVPIYGQSDRDLKRNTLQTFASPT